MRLLRPSWTALAAGLVLAGAAAAQADRPVSDLERAGWTLITMSEDVDVYMRPETAGDTGHRRAWTAYDAAAPRERDGFSFRSVESLSEFDCRKRLSRVVREIYHDAPALQGKAWQSPKFMATPWAAPQPGSVGAIRMAYACKALAAT
jgi:hypothetical protein